MKHRPRKSIKRPARSSAVFGLDATDTGDLGEPGLTRVVAALPVNGNMDWGVCGRQIASDLSRRTQVHLVTDNSPGEGKTQRTPLPLLQAITSSTDLTPFRPNLRSTSLTVGYTFFEENILSSEAVQNARRSYDHIVTASTWCEDVLRGHQIEAVSTILQGIDPLVFHPSPTHRNREFGDRFVVFSGGKLEFRKGQDLVIRAFKVLQDRHPDVLLVNTWFNPLAASLDTMAVSPYIEFKRTSADHVEFVSNLLVANGIDLTGVLTLPGQPNGRMPNVYWDTDVGLFPNRCEGGTNLVLMEYMASGKPAIVSYTSGHRDIVTDENALLIKNMTPLLMNDDDLPIATWDDPSLDETIERLEWAYQHRADLQPIADRAGLDLATLTWSRTGAALHALLEPPGLANMDPQRSGMPMAAAAEVQGESVPRATPKLSICIPTFNRCRYLENALTHLFDEQRFPFEFEVLVSDNDSTDGTPALVEEFMGLHRQLRYIRQTQSVGGPANYVAALREARGEYTVYLADDDVLFPKALGKVIRYLERHQNVGVCFCPYDIWDNVQKVSAGQFYDSGAEVVFTRDKALDLCNFIVERHVFPEIFVYRSEILRKLLYSPNKAYWAFVNMINALGYADVAFLPTIFYRSITRHWEGDQREQAGITQTMADWDTYRGGIEYMLQRAFTYAGFAGVPPEHRAVTQQMVHGFVAMRMLVALRLLIQCRQYVSAYEVLQRLRATGALADATLAEYRGFLVGRAAMEAFMHTFHVMTKLQTVGLFHVDGPLQVCALIDEMAEGKLQAEVLDQVDLAAITDKDRYLVLAGDGQHRQTLIEGGFPPGQVWAEGDLTRQFRI